MKRLVLVAAGAAVVGLTACSHGTATTAASASHSTVTPAAPVSCSKQYHTWEHGPGKRLISTFHAVSVASMSGDTHVLTAALGKAGPAIARAVSDPIPACADPRGYWTVLLMHMNAAVGSKGPVSSKLAALKSVPEIEQKLTAELKATAQ